MGENYQPSVKDKDWAMAGAVASLFNAAGRICWGAVADHTGVKAAIVVHCALSSTLYFTLCVLAFPAFFFCGAPVLSVLFFPCC
jgi:MFS family permease